MAKAKAKKSAGKSEITPARKLLEFARQQLPTCREWPDLHNAVYGVGAMFGRLFPDQAARTEFAKSAEFREIAEMIRSLPGPGDSDAASDQPSGRILVRLPASIHAALIREADQEGCSLNQLIVAKVTAQLRDVVG